MQTRFTELDPRDFALPPALQAKALSPALVVVLDHVRENVRRMLAYTGGTERWRPHVKTTKIPAVWRVLADAGLRRFKCATTREARLLLDVLDDYGGGDLLVAYPLVGPALDAVGVLAREHPASRVSVLCETPSIARDVPAEVSIFVDVNPGMHRTGIPAGDRAAILAVASVSGARFRGIHFYDGHLHDADLDARRRSILAGYDVLLDIARELREAGHDTQEIITSGTPAFRHALADPRLSKSDDFVHRVSPGTVVFHDLRTERENPDVELVPAAFVLARVVSHPADDIVTCDAGSKSIAAEAGDPCAFAIGYPGLEAMTPSEEHLPLRVTSGTAPERGAVLALVPMHICPTVNLAEKAWLLDGTEARIVDVQGRAHDMT